MSVTAEELEQFKDQKVIVTKNLKEPNEKGELAVEIEGSCEAVNAFGMMIKPKGKVNADIIELGDIEAVRHAPVKLTPIKQKALQPVIFGQARKHLAERHGIDLDWINANTEEAALKYHNELDHSKLGHKHEAKSDTEKAVDEAAADNAA